MNELAFTIIASASLVITLVGAVLFRREMKDLPWIIHFSLSGRSIPPGAGPYDLFCQGIPANRPAMLLF